MFELTKEFRFDAAHTLQRDVDAESSRRIHGHSYRAEISLRGRPDPVSGMIVDTTIFEHLLKDTRDALDHRLLDEINDLGPATLENLSAWIWRRLSPTLPGLFKVQVLRDSAQESCTYWGPEERSA
jgi:6-pyruvoyltetrahydropterin/6-carboxytetrahydropterin synthase